MTVFTIVALILSVIVHEVAHGYAAHALGDPTAKLAGRLTLNPLPHIDPIGSVLLPALLVMGNAGILFGWAKPVPYNPYNLKNQRWGEAIVGIAGVATNLFLAVLFALIGRFTMGMGMEEFALLSFTVAWINLFLGLFNLIPFPPLDGFTVLRGILPFHMAAPLRELEMRLGGFVGLVLFLLVFSYVFADPFFRFARWVFELLAGV
ncbi:MAG: site-2 protease family protein [Minisyncoccia bacterium]